MTVTKMIALLYTMPEHTEVLAWDLPSERYQPVVGAILHVNKETLTIQTKRSALA
jgi:hypothetical protein